MLHYSVTATVIAVLLRVRTLSFVQVVTPTYSQYDGLSIRAARSFTAAFTGSAE